jgi:hypothetical protein
MTGINDSMTGINVAETASFAHHEGLPDGMRRGTPSQQLR